MRILPVLLFTAACSAVTALAQDEVVEQTRSRETYTAVGVDYDYENFDELSDWHLTSVEVKRKGSLGSIIGRVTHGDRFDRTGQQFEVDAYPRLGRGTYAYLNVGYSDDSIFPKHRLGAQIYRSLPRSWEASLGVRWLDFENSDATIWTGSIGKYKGNWYFSAQPYVSEKDPGTSASVHGLARRYYRTADDYLGVRVGYGEVPEQAIFLADPVELQSWSARIEGKRRITRWLIFSGSLGVREQEIRRGSERQSVFASVGIERRF